MPGLRTPRAASRRTGGVQISGSPPDEGDDEKEGAADGQLHRQKGQGCDVVDDLLGDDGADAPAAGRGDQGGDRGARRAGATR